MAKIETIKLDSCSGSLYEFDVYPIGTNFKALAAIYFISKRNDDSSHSGIYLGITDDISNRFNKHHKEDCFNEHNANCISILINSSEEEREMIEKDILCKYNFPCNEVNN